MKKFTRFLPFVLVIATLLLSACGAAAARATAIPGAGKVEPVPVAFIGTVDSMAGDQWVINGQTVTVAPDVIRDGPFNIGAQVKVEGVVNADGSLTVSRVEVPTPQDASTLPQLGDDNSNSSNSNDANINDGNINDDNGNDGNINDDNSNSGNLNDDNGNDDNSNDDNSNDANSNDDNGNDSNSNDDNGGNDNSDDGNSNDDNSNSGGDDDNDGDDDDNAGGGGDDDNDDNGNGG